MQYLAKNFDSSKRSIFADFQRSNKRIYSKFKIIFLAQTEQKDFKKMHIFIFKMVDTTSVLVWFNIFKR